MLSVAYATLDYANQTNTLGESNEEAPSSSKDGHGGCLYYDVCQTREGM
jgi:hypothetical protein